MNAEPKTRIARRTHLSTESSGEGLVIDSANAPYVPARNIPIHVVGNATFQKNVADDESVRTARFAV